MAIFWLNGEFVEQEQAKLPFFDHGLLYGDGVFEGLRFFEGHVFRLTPHLDRLYRSARALYLTIPYSADELASAVEESIKEYENREGIREGYIRLVATRGEGKLGIDPSSCARGNVFMIVDQLSLVPKEVMEKGANVIISSTRRVPPDSLDSRIKSLNYLNSILARIEANRSGAQEAILLNKEGKVAEGTTDNVFIVTGGILRTPPVTDGALEGITRGVILNLAQALKIANREESLTPYDLYTADECFLTGTGAELIPVGEIDGRPLPSCPGSVFMKLRESFLSLARGVPFNEATSFMA